MSLKYTKTLLQKTEQIFSETNFKLRYEQGNFQSGFCLLENKKIVIVNKFLILENKINTLFNILNQLNVDFNLLSIDSKKIFKQISNELKFKQEVYSVDLDFSAL